MANFHVDYNYRDHLNTQRRIVADLSIATQSGAGNTITSAVGSSALSFSALSASSPEDVLGIPTYLGCFRLDTGATTDTRYRTQFTYGAIAGRQVGGNTRLFITSGIVSGLDGSIIEVQDPGSYSTNYATAPVATRTGYWTAGYASVRGTWRGATVADPPAPPFITDGIAAKIGGLYWNESLSRLFMTYEDKYNVSGFKDWGLISIELSALDVNGEGTSIGHGPWRLKATDADGNQSYGPHRGLWITAHPISGKLICGASLESGNAGGSWGPSLYGALDWPTDGTTSSYDAPDLELTRRWLNHYYPGAIINEDGEVTTPPLRTFRRRVDPPIYEHFPGATPYLSVDGQTYTDAVGLTGSWNEMDRTSGQIWIQGATKQGVVFCGFAAGSPSQDPTDPYAGHEYYGNGLNNWICSHGFDYRALFVPPRNDPATGPNTHAAFPWLGCYSASDLEAVENTTSDYVPEPVWFVNMETQYPGIKTGVLGFQGGKNINGFYFDAATKKLYMAAHQADDSAFGYTGTLIHVFQWDET